MNRTRKLALIGGTVAAVAAGGTAVAIGASGGDDAREQVSGPAADKATAAALAITGGKANAVERDGEKGATWEVEVTKPNGKVVDVRLDENYELVVVDGDGEDPGEE